MLGHHATQLAAVPYQHRQIQRAHSLNSKPIHKPAQILPHSNSLPQMHAHQYRYAQDQNDVYIQNKILCQALFPTLRLVIPAHHCVTLSLVSSLSIFVFFGDCFVFRFCFWCFSCFGTLVFWFAGIMMNALKWSLRDVKTWVSFL